MWRRQSLVCLGQNNPNTLRLRRECVPGRCESRGRGCRGAERVGLVRDWSCRGPSSTLWGTMTDVDLRQATAADSEFAFQTKKAGFHAYADTVWGWNEAEQRQLHGKRFATQQFSVIQWSGVDVGILSVSRKPHCVHLHQLFILPAYQNRGIGEACMKQVIAGAQRDKLSVELRVLKVNPRALAFYRRLGFIKCGDSDTHVSMERQA